MFRTVPGVRRFARLGAKLQARSAEPANLRPVLLHQIQVNLPRLDAVDPAMVLADRDNPIAVNATNAPAVCGEPVVGVVRL